MPVPSWPPGLPQEPLRDSYAEAYPNNLLRYEPDSGIAKVRRKSGLIAWPLTVPFFLNKEEKELLELFVTSTLSMGALRFTFPHPTKDGVLVEVRMVPGSDALYNVTMAGFELYNATLTLEVLP